MPRQKKDKKKFAVLEIDEASLSRVTKYIQPKLFVFTNIFRDQMDRYGENLYDVSLNYGRRRLLLLKQLFLCNGDSPIFLIQKKL